MSATKNGHADHLVISTGGKIDRNTGRQKKRKRDIRRETVSEIDRKIEAKVKVRRRTVMRLLTFALFGGTDGQKETTTDSIARCHPRS